MACQVGAFILLGVIGFGLQLAEGRNNLSGDSDSLLWNKLTAVQKKLAIVNETLIMKSVNLPQYGAQQFFVLLHDPITDVYESKDVLESRPWHPHICKMFYSYFKSYEKSRFHRLRMIDIGGNIGFLSILAASMYKNLDIIAIEPAKRHAVLFNESLKLQHRSLSNRVVLKNVAVGAVQGGVACMTWETHNAAATSVSTVKTDKPCVDEAIVTTVDAVINQTWPGVKSIDIVKMDIEGYEMYAMQGASYLLEQLRPKLFITEFVPWRMKKFGIKDPVQQFLSLFFNRGYIVRDIITGTMMDSIDVAVKYFNEKGPEYFTDLEIVDRRPIK